MISGRIALTRCEGKSTRKPRTRQTMAADNPGKPANASRARGVCGEKRVAKYEGNADCENGEERYDTKPGTVMRQA
jgi:hypothetical protein